MLNPSPRQLIPRMTLLGTRRSFKIFSFTFFFFGYFSLFSLLWQFATVYNVFIFLCLMKRYQFLLHESLFSLQYLFVVCEVIICPLMKLKNDDVSKSEYPDFNKANSNKPLLIHMN